MKNSRIFLASVLALSATITVNAQNVSESSEEITTVWQTVVEYKTATDDMSAVPTAAGTDVAETASAMEPVKTGAPEAVDGDADNEVDEDVSTETENDEAAPATSKAAPSATSAVEPEASAAPVDEAVESSDAEAAPTASNSADAEVAPTASKSAAAEKSQAADVDASEDGDVPVASPISSVAAPAATPSGSASEEAQEVVPGFPAALLPNANGDIDSIASESSMAAPIVATALPSLSAVATNGRSMSASASGIRPSISLKDMSASAAGSSPTGNVHSGASKVAFAGVSVAALAFASILLL
ncbi:hypothetical protein BC943DRAFT_326282 [Umbelopsis sp. AD052]|nr:hypothetical protein BC943DRAFT_326282 [Umbelopsis sp. AD052]